MPQETIITPVNTILAGGVPEIREYEVGANATAAKMLPGRFVIFDTVETAVKEAGAKAHGVIGVIMEKPDGALTDAYAVGDHVRVITGPAVGDVYVLVTELQSGGAVNPGTAIVTAADGKVAIAAVAALGSQGDIVGEGVKVTADPVAADANIVIKMRKVPEGQAIA